MVLATRLVVDGIPSTERRSGDRWLQEIDEIINFWTSCDGGKPGYWDHLLDSKRHDSCYPKLIELLYTQGFRTCLNADVHGKGLYPSFGNGHHRLAAAIELGYKYVPLDTNYWGGSKHLLPETSKKVWWYEPIPEDHFKKVIWDKDLTKFYGFQD